jgi:hypothetical protein
MSDTQIMTEASSRESGKTDDPSEALGLRYTPLRSHVITRSAPQKVRGRRALSRLIPAARLRTYAQV